MLVPLFTPLDSSGDRSDSRNVVRSATCCGVRFSAISGMAETRFVLRSSMEAFGMSTRWPFDWPNDSVNPLSSSRTPE